MDESFDDSVIIPTSFKLNEMEGKHDFGDDPIPSISQLNEIEEKNDFGDDPIPSISQLIRIENESMFEGDCPSNTQLNRMEGRGNENSRIQFDSTVGNGTRCQSEGFRLQNSNKSIDLFDTQPSEESIPILR